MKVKPAGSRNVFWDINDGVGGRGGGVVRGGLWVGCSDITLRGGRCHTHIVACLFIRALQSTATLNTLVYFGSEITPENYELFLASQRF